MKKLALHACALLEALAGVYADGVLASDGLPTLDGDIDESWLRHELKRELSAYKIPKRIVAMPMGRFTPFATKQ